MKRNLLALAGLSFIVPGLAFGSEGGEALSPFAGDFGVALWTLVIFLLVVWVLGKFAWGPVLGALQGREEFIRQSLVDAKRERQEAEAHLKEVEARLTQARSEASEIVEQGHRSATQLKTEIEDSARQEADALVTRARHEIDLAREAAVKDLYSKGSDLVIELAERVVRRELSSADHERLIAEAVDELGRFEN